MFIVECPACGRLWVLARDRTSIEIDLLLISTTHGGGRFPSDASSWPARCSGKLQRVRPWSVLRAAFKLGGREAAEALIRAPDRRHVGVVKDGLTLDDESLNYPPAHKRRA